ncbi:MAG TPA: hypothetical protein ENK72_00010 [Epsilonproteobacteria bacterium]|nr:hypothetical protein [Campylobacterota bacterium]
MQKILAIHYACADLVPSPESRVTAISVYDLSEDQLYRFSLHEAQTALGNVEVEALERHILQALFTFVHQHPDVLWIHWHMHSSEYGFEVLKARYHLLTGKETEVVFETLNLPDQLYAEHQERCGTYPKMLATFESNELLDAKIMEGERESFAYQNEAYEAIQYSSSAKAKAIGMLYRKLQEHRAVMPCSDKKMVWIGLSLLIVLAIVLLLGV